MLTIQIATSKDAEVLALLGRVTYAKSHGHYINNETDLYKYSNKSFSVSKTREDLDDKNIIFFLAYVNDFPVGYAKLVLNYSYENIQSTKVCKLERIYVLNDFIAQKVGSKLIDIVQKKAIELNFDTLWLAVYYKNQRAIRFYQKNSFENVGEIIFKVEDRDFKNHVLSKKLLS